MMTKNCCLAVAVGLIVAIITAACAAPAQPASPTAGPARSDMKDMTIGFVGAFGSTYWTAVGAATQRRAEDLGVKWVKLASPISSDAQRQAVEDGIAQGVSAIIILPLDPGGWDQTLEKAHAARVVIVVVDAPINSPYVSALVQSDNLSAAREVGSYLCQQLGKKGSALVLAGAPGHQTGDARRDGAADALANCGIEPMAEYSGWDMARAEELTRKALETRPDLVAIFAAWDYGALQAAAAVKKKGVGGKVLVAGFNGEPGALYAVKAGDLAATARQDAAQIGREGVDAALRALKGEKVEATKLIPALLVTKDNVDQVMK